MLGHRLGQPGAVGGHVQRRGDQLVGGAELDVLHGEVLAVGVLGALVLDPAHHRGTGQADQVHPRHAGGGGGGDRRVPHHLVVAVPVAGVERDHHLRADSRDVCLQLGGERVRVDRRQGARLRLPAHAGVAVRQQRHLAYAEDGRRPVQLALADDAEGLVAGPALPGLAAGGAHDVGVGAGGGRVQQQSAAAEGLVVGVRDGDQQAGGGSGGVAHRRLRSLRSRCCTPQYALSVDAAQRSMCEDAA